MLLKSSTTLILNSENSKWKSRLGFFKYGWKIIHNTNPGYKKTKTCRECVYLFKMVISAFKSHSLSKKYQSQTALKDVMFSYAYCDSIKSMWNSTSIYFRLLTFFILRLDLY